MLKSFQFHVTWNVTAKPFFSAKPKIDERDYLDLLKDYKPFELVYAMAYIKRETPPGSLCYVLLQKNVTGTHVNPEFGKFGFREGPCFYVEVQKKMPDKIFEGDDFLFGFPSPRPFFGKDDLLNLNLKASNSSWRLRTVDFLLTLGINVDV